MHAEIIDRSRPPVMPLDIALRNASLVPVVFKRLEAEATHEPTGIHFFVTQERQVGTVDDQVRRCNNSTERDSVDVL